MSGGPSVPPSQSSFDVAVVVVNYNSGQEVSRCVRSILEADGGARAEVLIVDNHSRDGSARTAALANPGTRLIENGTNRGFIAAANQGISATTAPFIFLLNPDAELASGTLGGLVKVALDRPRAGAIGVLTRNPDGTVYPSARKIPTLAEAIGHAFLGPFAPDNRFTRAYTMADWDRGSHRRVDWVSGSSMLLRRAALDQVGLLDEGYWMYVEDLDICTRLRAAGWEVWFSPEVEVVHIGGTATVGRKHFTLRHSMSVYRYFVKFRSPGWKASLRPMAWIGLRSRAALVSWRRGER